MRSPCRRSRPTATRSSAGAAVTCSWCRGAASRSWGVAQGLSGASRRLRDREEELAAWIAEINGAYRGLDLTLSDVAHGGAGLVPLRRERSRRRRAQVRPSLPDRRPPRRTRPGRVADPDRRALHDRPGRGERGRRSCQQGWIAACRRRVEWLPVHGGGANFEALVSELSQTAPASVSRPACWRWRTTTAPAHQPCCRWRQAAPIGRGHCPAARFWAPRSRMPPTMRWQ